MKERELQIREDIEETPVKKSAGHWAYWIQRVLAARDATRLECDVIGYALDPKPQDLYHHVPSFHPP